MIERVAPFQMQYTEYTLAIPALSCSVLIVLVSDLSLCLVE